MTESQRKAVIKKVRDALKAAADEAVREGTFRFFKEEVNPYGVKSADVRRIAKTGFAEVKNAPKEEIFALCEALWRSGRLEEGGIACEWSHGVSRDYEPADFAIFEAWLEKYVKNWASCDTLCNHTVGTFLEMYPEFMPELKRWAVSENRWLRRAAAVSLIVPAKKGLFLPEIFTLAEMLLLDEDDMVQKGYGWMLKVASQAGEENQRKVFRFVMKHKREMPRTALRYAIEKMPAEMKAEAMKK